MNATREQLRAVVAQYFEVTPTAVGPDFSLAGHRGEGSIARAALDAAIRRSLGLRSTSVYTAKTVGQIEAELFREDEAPSALAGRPVVDEPVTARPVASFLANRLAASITCGVDLESVAALPVADDYWEHPFYLETFSASEIAYCVAQSSPRPHFAARWCAKEALRKCSADFLHQALSFIEVVRDPAGAPSFRIRGNGEDHPLPFALSLSHTEDSAVAVVVSTMPGPVADPMIAPSPAPQMTLTPSAPSPPSRRVGLLLWMMTFLSLAASAFAVYRTYVHG